MTKLKKVLKAGTRPSSLAVVQTRDALNRIEGLFEEVAFEMVQIVSSGDVDRVTDLRESPANFFTRELDSALLNGDIDCAVHSAKDLPESLPKGIGFFWLPWREEPRDVLVLAQGRRLADLPENPVIGVSSFRRAEYCSKYFPTAIQKNIRGNIEERIAQVDAGSYDIVIMAAAALVRLNMEDRICEWIPLEELEVPKGQGYLAVTFREGDSLLEELRDKLTPLFKKRVLLTCSEALQEQATDLVYAFGGMPIQYPLIQLERRRGSLPPFENFDWLIVTSPSSVHIFMQLLNEQMMDSSIIPKIMVCGRGTTGAFLKYNVHVTVQPKSGYGSESLLELAKKHIKPSDKVLRVRSDKAGPWLASAIRKAGVLTLEDRVIYDNKRIVYEEIPDFDIVFFASASAVESFINQWGADMLKRKITCVIGKPTVLALEKNGIVSDVIACEATISDAVKSLVEHYSVGLFS